MGGLAAKGKRQAYCLGLWNLQYAQTKGETMIDTHTTTAAVSTKMGRIVFILLPVPCSSQAFGH